VRAGYGARFMSLPTSTVVEDVISPVLLDSGMDHRLLHQKEHSSGRGLGAEIAGHFMVDGDDTNMMTGREQNLIIKRYF
jgi:hypothetical protein